MVFNKITLNKKKESNCKYLRMIKNNIEYDHVSVCHFMNIVI